MLTTRHISADLLAHITKINEVNGAWCALGARTPERLFSLREVVITKSRFKLNKSANAAQGPGA